MENVVSIIGVALLIMLLVWITGIFRKKEDARAVRREYSELLYYICIDNEVYGGFTLSELKNDYPISEDTLITTDTLNGEWYEARCFECFDDLFGRTTLIPTSFRVNEFGEIIRL